MNPHESQAHDSQHAEPGLGAPRQHAVPGLGDPRQHAKLGLGAPGDGAPGDGAPGDGAPGDGAPGDGAPGDGAPGDGAPGDGAPGNAPVGWYSRGYLPHYNNSQTLQSVTFRLADSLPQSKLRELERELRDVDPEKSDAARRKQIEVWLDSGMGCCALKHPVLASLMQETLLKFDGDRYRLIAWSVMPNHVHVLIETKDTLSRIVQSWKSYTGRWALEKNAELGLGVPGKALWMREYWDRYIRNAAHFDNVVSYIERNPVAAGLCKQPFDWPWSSASARIALSGSATAGSAPFRERRAPARPGE
jgi:putative transposase